MGVVHLARKADGPRVALKVLRPHIVGDDEARARLAREVASLERIRSRWIAEIVDADPWGPTPYVATRYVPGLSLHDHVPEEGPIPDDDLRWFAGWLAEGVASVHAVGVLHRDVKPSNVLIEGRAPILIDFGLARVADDPKLTHTGWLLGTPGYLAPEILLRRRRHHRLRPALLGRHRRLRRHRQPAVRPRPVHGDHGPRPSRRARPVGASRRPAGDRRRGPPARARPTSDAAGDPRPARCGRRGRPVGRGDDDATTPTRIPLALAAHENAAAPTRVGPVDAPSSPTVPPLTPILPPTASPAAPTRLFALDALDAPRRPRRAAARRRPDAAGRAPGPGVPARVAHRRARPGLRCRRRRLAVLGTHLSPGHRLAVAHLHPDPDRGR